MMEVTCLEEIETARRTLLENCGNLEQIADYCEDNYVKAKDKRVALQETKNYTTQSLASVAYQINTLATSMLQMLDCTASKIGTMDSSMNQINLTIDLNNERISRQTIKSSLMTPKDYTRSHKLIKPDAPSFNNSKVKYVSIPIDYGSLDDVGHGLKLGLPSSSPRVSRSGSTSSMSSRGSPQGSVRQKGSSRSVRSPLSVAPPTSSSNSLQPPVFTEPTNQDDSLNTYSSVEIPPPPSPPPPSPPNPPQLSEGGYLVPPGPVSSDMGAGVMSEDQAIPPLSPLPPPPPPEEVGDGLSSDDLPPPPRPTSLLLLPQSQSSRSTSPSPRSTSPSPCSTSPNPQQQVSSSPIPNGSTNHLHVPGAEQLSTPKSPGKTRKTTLGRKGSRSPRPMNRPPPPPSAEGHTISPEVSNPLYFSAPDAPPPPPAPAPTPSGGPPTPPGGGAAPPPPPPPPPIGGIGAKKPASSTNQEHSAQAAQKKPPAQATVSFADQLKQRLAKLESEKVVGDEQSLETKETRDEPNNNNQTIGDLPPPTAETIPGLAADSGPVESEMEKVTRAGFISEETTEWPPTEFLWKGVALFNYAAMREDEMTFQEGDLIYLIHDFQDGWLVGLCNGIRAMVPGNYLEQMP